MVFLYIDIETLPTTNSEVIQKIKESIKPPGNITKEETKAKWMEENFYVEYDKAFRKTALDGLYGEILSIAWAFGNDDPSCIIRDYDKTESWLLEEFFKKLIGYRDRHGNFTAITKWIGHYITGFDLRFIWQRCVINRVRPQITIPYDAKPWDDKVFDTKVAWTGLGSYTGSGSMKALAPVFGLHKSEMDGSKVYDYWLDGKLEEIVEYNKQDVEDCRSLFKRMTFQ